MNGCTHQPCSLHGCYSGGLPLAACAWHAGAGKERNGLAYAWPLQPPQAAPSMARDEEVLCS